MNTGVTVTFAHPLKLIIYVQKSLRSLNLRDKKKVRALQNVRFLNNVRLKKIISVSKIVRFLKNIRITKKVYVIQIVRVNKNVRF